MNFKQIAHDIVQQSNDERWMVTREKVEAQLMAAYRLGFVDGEASVKPHLVFDTDTGTLRVEGRTAADAEDVTGVCV